MIWIFLLINCANSTRSSYERSKPKDLETQMELLTDGDIALTKSKLEDGYKASQRITDLEERLARIEDLIEAQEREQK